MQFNDNQDITFEQALNLIIEMRINCKVCCKYIETPYICLCEIQIGLLCSLVTLKFKININMFSLTTKLNSNQAYEKYQKEKTVNLYHDKIILRKDLHLHFIFSAGYTNAIVNFRNRFYVLSSHVLYHHHHRRRRRRRRQYIFIFFLLIILYHLNIIIIKMMYKEIFVHVARVYRACISVESGTEVEA